MRLPTLDDRPARDRPPHDLASDGRAESGRPAARDPIPLHRLDVPEPGVLPFAIGSFDSIGPMSRASFPHRHTFHEILYVTGGTGTHVVDLVGRPLCPPHLCFVAPGQVHYWEAVTGLQGWVVLFTDDFLLAHPEDRDALRDLSGRPWLRLGPDEVPRIAPLVHELAREYAGQADGFISVLRAYLHVLVTRAGRLAGPAAGEVSRAADGLAREFADLLAARRPAGSVGAYAARLGVSVSHLTGAVKAATGRTPGQLIRQARTVEAKRLLASTGLAVGQVARAVGFADPAYFCRFFRRETGLSPGDFRRGERGNHHDGRVLSIDPPEPIK